MLDKKIFDQTYKWEKGYVDVKEDKGGLTNDGITYSFYLTWCKIVLGINPSLSHFSRLKMTEKRKFYNHIWERLMLNKISNIVVAANVFDFCFNSGNAKKVIQKLLQSYNYDLQADNIFGAITLSALNDSIEKFGAELVVAGILNDRQKYVESLVDRDSTQKRFLKGWTNRIEDWSKFSYSWLKELKK